MALKKFNPTSPGTRFKSVLHVSRAAGDNFGKLLNEPKVMFFAVRHGGGTGSGAGMNEL